MPLFYVSVHLYKSAQVEVLLFSVFNKLYIDIYVCLHVSAQIGILLVLIFNKPYIGIKKGEQNRTGRIGKEELKKKN